MATEEKISIVSDSRHITRAGLRTQAITGQVPAPPMKYSTTLKIILPQSEKTLYG